jgi:predicted phosphodiesterase
MPVSTWTREELIRLYDLKNKEKAGWKQIGKTLKKSHKACSRKYVRTNWKVFLKDPDSFCKTTSRKWTRDEMVQLDAYLQAGKSYDFIEDKLNRSRISIERQAQSTDWKAWREISVVDTDALEQTDEGKELLAEQLIAALLTITRYSVSRLSQTTEKDFLKKVNLESDKLPFSFSSLKAKADQRLELLGFKNPEDIKLGEGTYVIVGDSHGKHTKKDMFNLLKRVDKYLKPTKIIHLGHILDDDNDISYDWGNFDNLIVLSKIEELKFVQDQRNKFKFNYEIVRESISIGDLVIMNQDLIGDYVKTSISGLDSEIFDPKVIVNCHRHEFFTRCTNETASYLASPGCLCERHIVRTIKQIDFSDGRVLKQAYWDGFIKYRRMSHMNKYWEMGLLVLHVDSRGRHTIVPCTIQKTTNGFATSYFDKIIASKGVFNPDKKIFVIGDMHCVDHEPEILDIEESICKDYKPDATVNLGDTHNYASLNHHLMDKGIPILNSKVIEEAAQTHFVLKRTAKWSKENYLIYGNHERFARDFIKRFPQFDGYLDFPFLCSIDSLGYKLTDLKDVLKIGSASFIHGDVTMFGQPGSKMEKSSRTFGKNIFVGHIHYPAIRFGCYSIGLTGKLDQGYNEPNASRWLHGLGLCNQFQGKSWLTTIGIVNSECFINGKHYKPSNPASWKPSKCKVSLVYDIK